MPEDDAASLAARVLRLEHALYPFVIASLANGSLSVSADRVSWKDQDKALAAAGGELAARLETAVIWP